MIDFLLGVGVGLILMGFPASSLKNKIKQREEQFKQKQIKNREERESLELLLKQHQKGYCDLYIRYSDEVDKNKETKEEIQAMLKRVKGAN